MTDKSITAHHEFAVDQRWQPSEKHPRNVSRLINAFVTDRRTGEVLIRFASPKGVVSRCNLTQMREWVINNEATQIVDMVDAARTVEKNPASTSSESVTVENSPQQATWMQQLAERYRSDFPKGDITSYFNRYDCCVLFIDGPHLHFLMRKLSSNVDFRRMLAFFQQNTALIHAQYYAAIPDAPEFLPIQRLTDWLSYHGYLVQVSKAEEYIDYNNHLRMFSNQAMHLAVDMLRLNRRVNHIILMAGDSRYTPVVEAVKSNGTVVSLVSHIKYVSDNLRRMADNFIDLESILGNFVRDKQPINN